MIEKTDVVFVERINDDEETEKVLNRQENNNINQEKIAETKPIEITTKRSFIQIFSSLIISVMVISIIVLSVLAVIRYRIEYGSSKLYCIE